MNRHLTSIKKKYTEPLMKTDFFHIKEHSTIISFQWIILPIVSLNAMYYVHDGAMVSMLVCQSRGLWFKPQPRQKLFIVLFLPTPSAPSQLSCEWARRVLTRRKEMWQKKRRATALVQSLPSKIEGTNTSILLQVLSQWSMVFNLCTMWMDRI